MLLVGQCAGDITRDDQDVQGRHEILILRLQLLLNTFVWNNLVSILMVHSLAYYFEIRTVGRGRTPAYISFGRVRQ
jgi:hypothetical protein